WRKARRSSSSSVRARRARRPSRCGRSDAAPEGRVTENLDAVVVGSGPNGLAAAVTLARAGPSVRVLGGPPAGAGGARTRGLGRAGGPGDDVGAAGHPGAWAPPPFAAADLGARGVELRVPEVSFAQPLDGGRAGIAYHDLDRTVERLGVD